MMFSFLSPALANTHPVWKIWLQAPHLVNSLQAIDQRLAKKEKEGTIIYPATASIFHALQFHGPSTIKVVILGQDPYHGENEAMGLSFSVPPAVPLPPSLRNIYKELQSDIGGVAPPNGDLRSWAQQGVLLLNSVLTVEKDAAASHRHIGWQSVTDQIIKAVSQHSRGCVFILWGNWAHAKAQLIDKTRHGILMAPHPSPLAAYRGFFGSHPFSQTNTWLSAHQLDPIRWTAA